MEKTLIYKLEILQLIEQKYGIEIKDEEVEYLETFEDLLELVVKKLEGMK